MRKLISNTAQNNDLFKLAVEVTDKYGIKPESIVIVQSASIKTVWKIKAQDKTLCLKRLRHSYEKALFSVYAQEFIKNSGGNVPSIIRDTSNNLIVNYNDQLFVLYEWLSGNDLEFNTSDNLKKAVSGLSRFHAFTKGYKAPEGARISSKLGKWPGQYESMKNKLISWKDIAKEKSSIHCYNAYLANVDEIIELSDRASKLLSTSSYAELTQENSEAVVLCHQDYGKGNAVLTDDGVYVIDLDGVTFDHPARDLRKIIGKLAENKGSWELSTISDILNWYKEANPLSPAEENLLYIDLLYPHWYFGLVKNLFKNNKPISTSKLEKISRLEKTKISLLNTLLY
jgi:spore coat protein I